ncbi:MAG: single-stranded DNA-binding protein [Ginsengibacter sp.]
MRSLNKVMLIGNLGKEPEYKTLQDGTAVSKLTLATTENFRLKSGESQTNTQWHTIIAWRGLATFSHDYMRKGSLVYVEGKLNNRNFEDKEGQKKFVTEIVAEQIILLDKKSKIPGGENTDQVEDKPLPF